MFLVCEINFLQNEYLIEKNRARTQKCGVKFKMIKLHGADCNSVLFPDGHCSLCTRSRKMNIMVGNNEKERARSRAQASAPKHPIKNNNRTCWIEAATTKTTKRTKHNH